MKAQVCTEYTFNVSVIPGHSVVAVVSDSVEIIVVVSVTVVSTFVVSVVVSSTVVVISGHSPSTGSVNTNVTKQVQRRFPSIMYLKGKNTGINVTQSEMDNLVCLLKIQIMVQ